MLDKKKLFSELRETLFGGSLTQEQVNGINIIIDGYTSRQLTDIRWLAYVLATVFHETARTFEPIREHGRGRGRKYGQPYDKTGQVYYGRGFSQLTWYRNYLVFSKRLRVDLVNNPDLALDPKISSDILWEGMINGLFTGVGLKKYFNNSVNDPMNARKIVNGLDKAGLISGYYYKFLSSIEQSSNDTVEKPNPKSLKDKTYRDPVVTGAGTVTITAAGQALTDLSMKLLGFSSLSLYLQYIVFILAFIGAALTVYAVFYKVTKEE